MTLSVQYRRPDGTFIATVNGLPYHIIQGDPRYADAQVIGANAPFEPVPEPAPVEPPLLSKVQWKFFLYVTGFDQAAASALAAMPKTNPQQIATWAGMKAVIEDSAYYRLSVALQLVASVRSMNLPGITLPTDAEVSTAWDQAANFHGSQSLGAT
jgi:hypothetical protein